MNIECTRVVLLSDAAKPIFGECNGYNRDYSLAALVRAIAVHKYGSAVVENDAANDAKIMYTIITSKQDLADVLTSQWRGVQVARVTEDVFTAATIDSDAAKGWKTFDENPFPVNRYLSQFSPTKIFINEERHSVLSITSRSYNGPWMQAFESVIGRLMPWFFPDGFSEEEKAFFKSLSVDKSGDSRAAEDSLVKYAEEAAQMIDLRALSLSRRLDGWSKKAWRHLVETAQDEADGYRSSIRDYQSHLSDLYASLERRVAELKSLKENGPQDNTEMLDFFIEHKNLELDEVSDDSMKFSVVDTLEFFDDEEFESVVENKSSYLYYNGFSQDVIDAAKGIFIEHRGVIRVSAQFKLSGAAYVKPMRNGRIVQNTMPNPHIHFFGCSGGNDVYYTQYANEGEWRLAIEQAISATKNLSMGDTTVCERMMSWITDRFDTLPCVYVKDDASRIETVSGDMRLVTFEEFLEMIKEH